MLLESMLPVSLDVALLKLRFPELVLRPGMQVVVRVASRGEGPRGAIVLAGQLLSAELPEEVRKGDTLRLRVAEISPQRVVLKMEGQTPAPGAPAQPAAQSQAAPAAQPVVAQVPVDPSALGVGPPPLTSQGLDARLDPDAEEEGRGAGGSARAAVSLVYETPGLGRLDLRLERGPEGVVVVVGAPQESAGLAREGAEELRVAIEERLGTAASVRVDERRRPFDAYA
jgi:hypothetical protein